MKLAQDRNGLLEDWPRGTGEMARRIRVHDWAATPLGPVARWPDRLKHAVELMLALPCPAAVAWGHDLLQFFNDHAAPDYAGLRPGALGSPMAETFAGSAAPLRAARDRLFATGQGFRCGVQPLAALFLDSWTPIKGDGGDVLGFLAQGSGAGTGGGEGMQAALRDSEARFRAFVTASSDVVYRMNADWSEMQQLEGNAFLNHTTEPSRAWLDHYIHPDDQEAVRAAIAQAIRTRSTFRLDHRVIRADGSMGWTRSRAVPVLGEDGQVKEWLGAASDITAAKQAELVQLSAEEGRRENEARLAAVFEILPMGIAVCDTAGQMVLLNSEMRRFMPAGLMPSHDPGRRWRWHAQGADGRNIQPDQFPGARALRGETVMPGIEMLYTQDDGHETWTQVAAVPVRDEDGVVTGQVSIVADIDAQKRGAEALRQSEERLLQFGEASQDILWMRDAGTLQWTYLTPAFEAVYGLDRRAALLGDNMATWEALILPEDREGALGSIRRVLDGEWITFDYRIRRPLDGKIRWLRDTDFPIKDEAGRVVRIGGVGHDVTALKEVEEALAAAEQRQRLLLEGIPQLVWRAVDSGDWTWASPQWTQYTGQSDQDSHGWGWLAPIHREDRDAARAAWSHAIETGGFEVELRILEDEEGAYRWFQTRASPVRDAEGRIIEWLGTSTDIHDLRELQDRQKVLVAELQHRTRNLLTVVLSMADKTARTSADLPEFRLAFRDRLSALARVQGLLSRLADHDRVTFDELIAAEMAALDGAAGRVTLDGPLGVRLRSSMVQTLAMALHELATNALKYGALGQPEGRMVVSWSLDRTGPDGAPWLHIDWREFGVAMPPQGASPGGSGQGRTLIERALPYQLGAKTTYVLGPDGVHCTILVPISPSPTA